MTNHRIMRAVIAAILVLAVAAQTPASTDRECRDAEPQQGPAPSAGCGVSQQGPVTEEKRYRRCERHRSAGSS